jgi:hypothetical protein
VPLTPEEIEQIAAALEPGDRPEAFDAADWRLGQALLEDGDDGVE